MKIRYFFISLIVVIAGIIYVNNKIEEKWFACRINNYNVIENMLRNDSVNKISKNKNIENKVTENKDILNLKSKSACVYDCNSKRTLYEKNAEERLPMASTTKIMTCIIALENVDLNDTCIVSAYAASMPDVQLNAIKGEKFRIGDLLYSLMLESHNDVAVVIAEHIGKIVDSKYNNKVNSKSNSQKDYDINNVEQSKKYVASFAKLMNLKAKELGLDNTNFVTPNGLDAENHYTTAVELAKVAAYAINNKDFIKITNTSCYSFKSDNGRCFVVNNKNQFLNNYSGAIGCKTGYTSKAGYCFVGAIDKCGSNNTKYKLVSVVLGCGWPPHKTYKWQDTKKLMDYAVENYSNKNIVIDSSVFNGKHVLVDNGLDCNFIKPDISETLNILVNKDENITLESKLIKKVVAPIKKEQKIGYIDVLINGKLYKRIYIKAKSNIYKVRYRNMFTDLLHFFTWPNIDIILNNL